jgi:lysophospholipase L1-like esterase
MVLRRRIGSIVLTAASTAAALSGLTACEPPDTYVALGDSYTAGPLIWEQSSEPLGCLRSNRNYPSVVAPRIRAAKFTDVSCSGAQTKHLTEVQGVSPGPNAPQLDAVGLSTKVVTVGIGGNDIGFSGIVQGCVAFTPWERGCRGDYLVGGRDLLAERISATAPKIDAVLAEIKRRAPLARVFVVGYPALLPESGGGCWPIVPMVSGDVSYLRDTEKRLNAMLSERAAAAGARYVDLYTPSIGHDMCSSSRWVEPILPGTDAAPVHPNATGMRNFADVVAAEINAIVTS